MKGFKIIGQLFKDTFLKWLDDNAGLKAAGLSYYSLISMVPLTLLILLVAEAVVVGSENKVRQELFEQLKGVLGPQASEAFRVLIEHVKRPDSGILAVSFGAITLMYGASHVFAQLKNAMNDIWSAKNSNASGLWGILRNRLLSVVLVAIAGLLMLILLFTSAGAVAFREALTGLLPKEFYIYLFDLLNYLLPFVLILLIFATIYKFLPDAKVAWKDVWLGAFLAAILFSVGRIAVGWYVGNSRYGSAYGFAGSAIIILIWIYFSAQVLLFGAEFTQVYAGKFGSKKRA